MKQFFKVKRLLKHRDFMKAKFDILQLVPTQGREKNDGHLLTRNTLSDEMVYLWSRARFSKQEVK
jgi:hypothetical protein